MDGAVSRLLTAAVAAFFLSSAPSPSAAATFEVITLERFDGLHNGSIDVDAGTGQNMGQDSPVVCNLLLQGPIEKGDTERLKALVEQNRIDTHSKVPRLCLHSPGGSYAEGLKLAEFLMDNNIGTGVPATAKCYSACAIIFMGGTFPWKGQINRFLHAQGTLGFHAPFIPDRNDGKQVTVDVKELRLLYADGIKAMSDFMKLGVGNDVKRITPELMQEMLAKGPGEFFYVDTVGKAIRFRIHLYGIDVMPRLDDDGICNACVNMHYGAYERYGRGGDTDLCKGLGPSRRKRFSDGQRLTNDVAPRGGSCSIDVLLEGDRIKRWSYVSDERDVFGDGLELAYWYLYSPNTQLASLAQPRKEEKPTPAGPGRRPDGEPRRTSDPPAPDTDGERERNAQFLRRLGEFVVRDYLGHGDPDHENTREMFAPQVVYFDKGTIARETVMREKQAYYRRWPKRSFELIRDTLRLDKGGDGVLTVTFRYVFEVTDGRQRRRGIAFATLGIVEQGGRFVIAREDGKVEKRF
ncbi:MAG: hypothetical protein R3D27_12290 [Hyphomicrobiaceae bacterium]